MQVSFQQVPKMSTTKNLQPSDLDASAASKPELIDECSSVVDDPVPKVIKNVHENTFGSFAPDREGNQVKWLVDGKDYMSEVADAIKAAQKEIFITDWQIHPYVHLKRPESGVTSLEWRLDQLLLEKAREGVRIYILLYWDKKFLDLDNQLFIKELGDQENIFVYRHPNYTTLRWSHHEKLVIVDRSIAFVGGIDLCFGRWDTNAHPLTDDYPHHPIPIGEKIDHDAQSEEKYCRWIGKDYCNSFYVGKKLEQPLEDILHKKSKSPIRSKIIPRMPWHDVSCMLNGKAVADIVKHFIQRYNGIAKEPISEGWEHPEINHSISSPSTINAKVQVVRSVAKWSVSQPASSHTLHEDSIHKAYLYAIEHAEHSVYIENQFFISSQGEKVENQVQEALACRIASAYHNKQNFHVMIILPLLPEGPLKKLGKTYSLSGRLFETVCYWNYATLYNGEHSLWEKLKKRNVPDEYRDEHVHVYGLRTHDAAKLVTELVYVHSKVMIVDDKLAIIGSANINDRSMLGNRDSEVDVVIEDQEMVSVMVNGNAQLVGKFSHSLRCQLMKEHLGLLEDSSTSIDVRDPVNQHYQNKVSDMASNNTEVYDKVFKCLPTDKVQTKKDLKIWKKKERGLAHTAPHKARTELAKIQGRIVTFSGKFLIERLTPCFVDRVSTILKSLSDDDLSDDDLSDDDLFDEYDIL